MTTYKQALTRLDDFSNFEKKAHLLKPVFSLQGIRDILMQLGNPHEAYPCVHVAGTVGKGSVCFITEAALRAAGFHTGLYISPHIRDIRERIRVNGKMISRKDFAKMYDAIIGPGNARPDEHTYFEALTAIAFQYFAEQRIDIAVIETGLGGRLDSTNVVPGFVSVITRIGHDHKAVLGNTLRQIAREKAGIIKQDTHLVTIVQHPAAHAVLHDTCANQNTNLTLAPAPEPGRMLVPDAPEIFSSNAFYRENLGLASTVLEVLSDLGYPTTRTHLVKALNSTEFPARMQWSKVLKGRGTVRILVDAGHNAPAAHALRRALEHDAAGARVIAVTGMMRDKDASAFLRALAPACSDVICVQLDTPRAWPVAELAMHARKTCAQVHTAPNTAAALNAALKMSRAEDVIVFTGTFYAIDRVLDWIDEHRA